MIKIVSLIYIYIIVNLLNLRGWKIHMKNNNSTITIDVVERYTLLNMETF